MELSLVYLTAAAVLIIHHLPLISCGIIGVNYGFNGDNLPAAADVINLYERCGINIVRIYEPNEDVLNALRGKSKLMVSVGTRNEDIQSFASNQMAANSWVNTNIVPFHSDVNIGFITVGNEVIPGDIAPFVAGAIKNMMQALLNAGVTPEIKVTTVVSMSVLSVSYPPSAGTFTDAAAGAMKDIAQILSSSSAPIMLNAYPYFAYASNPQQISLSYALFTATSPIVQDGTFNYFNLFDAMVDSFYAALEKIGEPDVKIEVSETGWPSKGNEPFTSVENAQTYNRNFVEHVLSGKGTPRRPTMGFNGVLFEMFNEDLKTPGVEQNFGFFYPNMDPVYSFWSC